MNRVYTMIIKKRKMKKFSGEAKNLKFSKGSFLLPGITKSTPRAIV